jgi:alpha-L-rhamnosidase
MFGEVESWLYKGLGSIKPDPKQPGFRNVLLALAPHFATRLTHFTASHQGRYSTIRSAWQRVGACVSYTCTVPPSSTVTLTLPAGAGQAVYEGGKPIMAAAAGINLS